MTLYNNRISFINLILYRSFLEVFVQQWTSTYCDDDELLKYFHIFHQVLIKKGVTAY